MKSLKKKKKEEKEEEEEKEGEAEEEGEIFQWKIMKSQEYIPMVLNFASIKFSPFYFQLTASFGVIRLQYTFQ